MTSLFSNTMSPAKDGCSSLPRRSSNLSKPPLRALYDLLIAPMEGVSTIPLCVYSRVSQSGCRATLGCLGASQG